jgi:hypothetical protein
LPRSRKVDAGAASKARWCRFVAPQSEAIDLIVSGIPRWRGALRSIDEAGIYKTYQGYHGRMTPLRAKLVAIAGDESHIACTAGR